MLFLLLCVFVCDLIQICTLAVSNISQPPLPLDLDKVASQYWYIFLSQSGKEEEQRARRACRFEGMEVCVIISWPYILTAPALGLATAAWSCNGASCQLGCDDWRSVQSPLRGVIFSVIRGWIANLTNHLPVSSWCRICSGIVVAIIDDMLQGAVLKNLLHVWGSDPNIFLMNWESPGWRTKCLLTH